MTRIRTPIPPTRPYFTGEDRKNIAENIDKILLSGMLSVPNGEYITRFEKTVAEYVKTRYAVGVSSGTSALQGSIMSQRLDSGFDFVVPVNTFSATIMAGLHAGGNPIFVEMDPNTLGFDVKDLEQKITKKTKVMIIVHVGGIITPEIDKVVNLCDEENIFLIEDAAHAFGSQYKTKSAGGFGDAGCFSLSPTKIITCGEGGVITTNNQELDRFSRIIRDEGRSKDDSVMMSEYGFNWKLTEINASIGLTQMDRLSEILDMKHFIAMVYDKEMQNISGIAPMKIPGGCRSSYYKYIMFVDEGINKINVKKGLFDLGILCPGEVYDPPIHLQPFYKQKFGTKFGDYPVAEDVTSRMLCLPIFPDLNISEIRYVIDSLKKVMERV